METDMSPSEGAASALIITFAHDLRQPLRSMVMAAQRIQRKSTEISDETREKLDEILAAARKQDELIASVVEYDQALQVGDDSPLALRLTLQTACMKVDAFRKQKQGAIHVDTEAVPRVLAPTGLGRVLEKVLHNSLKFHAPENIPRVELEISEDEPGIVGIRVSDNGIGIEPQYREVVFEPFKRLNPASDYPGSGLGLSICRRLMDTMQGTIRLDGGRNGSGVMVSIGFPRLEIAN